MCEYTPPPNEPFRGDTKDPFVARFIEAMGKHRQSYALQVISMFVRAEAPPWLAEQCLAQLTQAINHVPPRMPHGVKLGVVPGGKE
jgi:hypothetical protein